MGQFSVEKPVAPGSVLSGNQHPVHFAIDVGLPQRRIHLAGTSVGDQDARIALGAIVPLEGGPQLALAGVGRGNRDQRAMCSQQRRPDRANEMIKGNADALTESGNASRAAVQDLTKAYQELTTKNARNVTAAMQALAAVKSPTDFIELQQRLIKEGVETAVGDSQRIAQLTTAVFTAAFEPVKKRIEAVQRAAHP
jgi:phasin family protein